ncbi:hypothetical protein, partial [Faecalibaculum rodentium]|uniref:hypothetical protein n=1 Tax=Faecalibaculum rodentium TaxID=1702221 RepID=UPI00262D1956
KRGNLYVRNGSCALVCNERNLFAGGGFSACGRKKYRKTGGQSDGRDPAGSGGKKPATLPEAE